jgi:hypothetical protein
LSPAISSKWLAASPRTSLPREESGRMPPGTPSRGQAARGRAIQPNPPPQQESRALGFQHPAAAHAERRRQTGSACAGMTAPGSTRVSQMTPLPPLPFPLRRCVPRC